MFNITKITLKLFTLLINKLFSSLTCISIFLYFNFNSLYAFKHAFLYFFFKLNLVLLWIHANVGNHLIYLIKFLWIPCDLLVFSCLKLLQLINKCWQYIIVFVQICLFNFLHLMLNFVDFQSCLIKLTFKCWQFLIDINLFVLLF